MTPEGFQAWWREFAVGLRNGSDAYESAGVLRRRLQALPAAQRRKRTSEILDTLLVDLHAFGLVLFLLEGLSDRSLLGRIRAGLDPLPGPCGDDEESHLADLIRLLAAARDPALLDVVRSYLLTRDIGSHWSTVPWALWPHDKQLFARAWTRFFTLQDPGDWTDTFVLRPFLNETEAIGLVREPLLEKDADRWAALRDALARQAGKAGWLTAKQRASLERVLR